MWVGLGFVFKEEIRKIRRDFIIILIREVVFLGISMV